METEFLKIKDQPYGPDTSSVERNYLKEQVGIIEGNIVTWKEVPKPSIYQIEVFSEKVRELTQDLDSFHMLIDLTEAGRPNPEIIEFLRGMFQSHDKLCRIAIFTQKNVLLNAAAKFILLRAGHTSFSIHKYKEEAMEALKNV